MNNNENNFVYNPQINSSEPETFVNNSNSFNNNQQMNNFQETNMNQTTNAFNSDMNMNQFNNNINNDFQTPIGNFQNDNIAQPNAFMNNNGFNQQITNNYQEYDDNIEVKSNNRFITSDYDMTSTALNDLNVETGYTNMPSVDYSQDPKVQENIKQAEKKNTVTITGEAKVFIIIIVAMLIFIIVMPYIFDLIRTIKY